MDALVAASGQIRSRYKKASRKLGTEKTMLNRSKSMKLLQSLKYAGVASLALSSSLAMASLTFDADGAGGDAAVQVDAFDWGPSSFLAVDGTTAITNWNDTKNKLIASGDYDFTDPTGSDALVTSTCGTDCQMTIYTHASLIGTVLTDGTETTPGGLGSTYEITIVTSFTETVTGTGIIGGQETATFDVVTSAGSHLEMYYDDLGDDSNNTFDANNLLGSGFNDGKLILSATTIEDSSGSFSVIIGQGTGDLDQAGDDNYPTIDTVIGSGDQLAITLGGFTLDDSHFLTDLAEFTMSFANISQQLPFISSDPSECFNQDFGGTAVGGTQTQATANCDQDFDAAMNTVDTQGGLTPDIGTVNGLTALDNGGDDFLAQTDFNSPVTGIPSPAPLALMSIGLLGLGFFGRRKAQHAA